MSILTKKRLAAAGAAAATAAVAVTLFAAPANAATSDCPSGSTCLWRDADYVTNSSGTHYLEFTEYIPDFSQWDYSGTTLSANDSASSIYNHGTQQMSYLYVNANESTFAFSLALGQTYSNLKTAGYNDDLSSGYFEGYL